MFIYPPLGTVLCTVYKEALNLSGTKNHSEIIQVGILSQQTEVVCGPLVAWNAVVYILQNNVGFVFISRLVILF